MVLTRLSRIAFLTILALAVSAAAFASPVASIRAGGAQVDFQVAIGGYDHIQMNVMTPDGEVFTRDFKAGQAPLFKLRDSSFADGTYTYELRVIPVVSDSVKQKLQEARNSDDPKAAERILREAGISVDPIVQSGAFSVLGGAVVNPDAIEPTGAEKAAAGQVTTDARPSTPVTNTPVQTGDLSINNSLCVGNDCTSSESFGFDTIRLKENNNRIHFDDTSTSAGFPNVDWQLTANDSASGGQNKFSIEDTSNSRVPFTVEANSTTNSLYVDSTGRIGFRTSTPVLDLHISTSNTPGIRLEQTSAGGFSAQSWDIAGNETNFFVRDVTSGSRLPFRIRPGAPTSSIDINASGNVGIGTASPSTKVDVEENANQNTILQVVNPNTGTAAVGVLRASADVSSVSFQSHGSGRTISRFGQTLASWNEMLAVTGNGLIIGTNNSTPLIFGTAAAARMTIDASGNVTVPGNFTVTGTKNFAVVDPANAKNALYYTALEGPEAGTYYRGTAKTVNGEVTIELPGYFARLTEAERMTVQLTPVGDWGQLYIASKSPEKVVIKVAAGTPDLEFDYFVQGVRKGYLNYEVERPDVFPVKR